MNLNPFCKFSNSVNSDSDPPRLDRFSKPVRSFEKGGPTKGGLPTYATQAKL